MVKDKKNDVSYWKKKEKDKKIGKRDGEKKNLKINLIKNIANQKTKHFRLN
jgi:hypothetical protein